MNYILRTIATLLLSWLLYYLCMPQISFFNFGFLVYLICVGIIIFLLFLKGEGEDKRMELSLFGIIPGGIGLFCLIMFGVSSCGMFHAHEYATLLGPVQEKHYKKDISPTNLSDIILLDENTAETVGNKKLADSNTVGSQVSIGDYYLQKVGPEMYYVAPLNYSGFFKWLNGDGTPGYIMVNAKNDGDVKYVTKTFDGKPIKMRYNLGGWFGEDLDRYVQKQFPTLGFTDYTFEIDDNGYPYHVYSTFVRKIGMSGKDITGVVIVDPMTGETKLYDIKDVPKWVDRVQAVDIITDQVNDMGELTNGYWNFSDKGKFKIGSTNLCYGSDNVCYIYASLTSVGSDQGTFGFLMINSRTKEVGIYRTGGVVEANIEKNAETEVSQYGYKASQSRPYNINGTLTYVMALKGDNGMIKRYALVDAIQPAKVGVGQTLDDAYRDLRSKLASIGNSIIPSAMSDLTDISSTVERINSDVVDGKTTYYFTVSGVKNKIFNAKSSLSKKIILTKINDKVHLKYKDVTGDGVIDLLYFDNLVITTDSTIEQIANTKQLTRFNDSIINIPIKRDIEERWNEMSQKDKENLLKNKKA